MLAAPDQIKALSVKSTSVASYFAARAAAYPTVRADADAVLSLQPDLVIASFQSDKRLSRLLKRLNIPVLTLPYSHSKKGLMAGILSVGAKLGQKEKTAAVIKQKQQLYSQIKKQEKGPQALYLTPGAYTTGRDTAVDRLFTLAGLDNYFDQKSGWFPLPLERLIKQPPKLIIRSFFDDPEMAKSPWGLAGHSRIKAQIRQTKTIDVPSKMISCNGLFMAEAALLIQRDL